jgi:hypothetical protein
MAAVARQFNSPRPNEGRFPNRRSSICKSLSGLFRRSEAEEKRDDGDHDVQLGVGNIV